MLFKTQSAAVYGIDANIIEVEVDVSPNRQPEDNFQTVGLPDAAVRESRQRIRAALQQLRLRSSAHHDHYQSGPGRYQEGRLWLRSADGHGHPWRLWRADQEGTDRICDGRRTFAGWRPARCARSLPIAVAARAKKIPNLIVPEVNAREAAVVAGVNVYPVKITGGSGEPA